jgi:hypothetical protein
MLCSYIHEKSRFPVYHTLFGGAGQAAESRLFRRKKHIEITRVVLNFPFSSGKMEKEEKGAF